MGPGTGSSRGTFLRLEREEDLAPLVRAISVCRNLAGSVDRRRRMEVCAVSGSSKEINSLREWRALFLKPFRSSNDRYI